MNPSSTPGRPLGGELSKVIRAGPVSLDPTPVLGDRADRGPQQHRVVQASSQTPGHGLRPALEAALLRAAGRVDQGLDALP
jgi:hypothetical protein